MHALHEVQLSASVPDSKPGMCDMYHTCMTICAVSLAGGIIQGDVRMNGFPKEQASFARVSGYVEQFDVHSPQTTVREALLFSAQLRTQGETSEVITAFVDEVMDLVELTPLRDGLVGLPTHCCCESCCHRLLLPRLLSQAAVTDCCCQGCCHRLLLPRLLLSSRLTCALVRELQCDCSEVIVTRPQSKTC